VNDRVCVSEFRNELRTFRCVKLEYKLVNHLIVVFIHKVQRFVCLI